MNKKGFTLVEILAVVVILGIILTLAVPNIIKSSQKSKENMYDSKVDMIEKAAELYCEDNHNLVEDGEVKMITVGELLENNYLKKDVKDCAIGNGCIKDTRNDSSMDNQKVCLCVINKRTKAVFVGDASNCNNTACQNGSNSHIDPEPPKAPVYTLTINHNDGTANEIVKQDLNTTYTPQPHLRTGGNISDTQSSEIEYTLTGWTHTGGGKWDGTKFTFTGNGTLKANWKEDVYYRLTYDSQGGSACQSTRVLKDNTWGTLCSPTRANYRFGGWYTGPDGTGTEIKDTTKPTSSQKVYAKWNIITYTLTYNSQGGTTCNPASITKNSGSQWGTLCSPTRSGYSFGGWYTGTNGTGNNITSSTPVTGNLNVYAKWTANYKIYFNANGGTGAPSTIELKGATATSDLPTGVPTRSGYKFYGWAATSSWNTKRIAYSSSYGGISASDGTTAITTGSNWTINDYLTNTSGTLASDNSLTLYAQWQADKYTLTYDSQGGTTCPSTSVTANNQWGTLCSPTRSGYSFEGWYTGTNGSGNNITSSTPATGNLTVYAKWKQNVSCTYDKYSDNRVWLGTYTCNGTTSSLTTCTHRSKGYVCNGGSEGQTNTYMCTLSAATKYKPYNTCSTSFTSSYTAQKGGEMTTTESCECRNLTVTYNPNGGTVSKTSDTVNYGGVLKKLPSPIRTGYTFEGWYTASSGGTRVYYYTPITSNTTLYAHWSVIVYTIKFDANGGSGVPSSITLNGPSTTSDISSTVPTKSGYTFYGWAATSSWNTKRIAYNSGKYGGSKAPDGSKAEITDSWNIQEFLENTGGSLDSSNTLTLYAQWYREDDPLPTIQSRRINLYATTNELCPEDTLCPSGGLILNADSFVINYIDLEYGKNVSVYAYSDDGYEFNKVYCSDGVSASIPDQLISDSGTRVIINNIATGTETRTCYFNFNKSSTGGGGDSGGGNSCSREIKHSDHIYDVVCNTTFYVEYYYRATYSCNNSNCNMTKCEQKTEGEYCKYDDDIASYTYGRNIPANYDATWRDTSLSDCSEFGNICP